MMAVFAFMHSPIPKVYVPSISGPLAMVKCLTSSSLLVPPPAACQVTHTHTHTHVTPSRNVQISRHPSVHLYAQNTVRS